MKTYIATIENKASCPMAWAVKERIKANTMNVAEMYANIAAKQWGGNLVSVTEAV